MAMTYAQTAWNTGGTNYATDVYYKDVSISASAGDLLVAFGASENDANTNGAITTQSGSTSAWTVTQSSGTANQDVGCVVGWATVSTGGTITVRVAVSAPSTGRMGAGLFCIPADEWTGTPTVTAFGGGDADGQVSLTLSATSTVLHAAGDWGATNPGTTGTPAGGTNRTSYYDTTYYAVFAHSWTTQASGTRNYGPSGLSGKDYAGFGVVIEEASSSNRTGTAAVTMPVPTVAATGEVDNPAGVTGTAAVTMPVPVVAAAGEAVGPRITVRASTAFTAAVDSATPFASRTTTLPTGSATGDLMLLVAGNKPYSTTPGTPTDWTQQVTHTNGTIVNGGGTGSVRATMWSKEHDGSESNPVSTFSTAYAPVAIGAISLTKIADTTWDVATCKGADTSTANTAFSATGDASLDWEVGDLAVVFVACKDDNAQTTDQHTSKSLTASGVTFDTLTVERFLTTPTGNDGYFALLTASVTGGATAAPTYAATANATNTSDGTVLFARVRAVDVNTDRTGTAAVTMPVPVVGASGTVVPPPITGTSAFTLPTPTVVAAGTTTPPAFTGTAAVALPSPTASASGTRTVPAFTGTAATTLPTPTVAASGTFVPQPRTGTATVVLPTPTAAASGTLAAPQFTGTAAVALPTPSVAATGARVPPAFTGTGAATLPSPTVIASGVRTVPASTGTAAVTLPTPTASASGTVANPPGNAGAAAVTLPTPTVTASGTRTIPPRTGTTTVTLPAPTVAITGAVNNPGFAGATAVTLPGPIVTATGVFTPQGLSGTGVATLPMPTVAASGTRTIPACIGIAAIVLPMPTVAAWESYNSALTGTAAVTLPAPLAAGTGILTYRYTGKLRRGGLAASWLNWYAPRYTSAILRNGVWQESDGLDEAEIMDKTESVDYFVGGRMYDITPSMHAQLESAGLT